MPSWLVVYNPAGGSSRKRRRIQSILGLLGSIGPTVGLVESSPKDTGSRVQAQLDGGVERVFVLGGDGTVGEVAGALVDTGIPLAVVPTGTTNVLAAELGIPMDPARALAKLASSTVTRSYHTWTGAGCVIILGVSAGFDGRLMHQTDGGMMKQALGPFGMGLMGLAGALQYEFPELRVVGEDDAGTAFDERVTLASATNTKRYAGRVVSVPDADPEDEFLDLMLYDTRSTARLIQFWLLMAAGTLKHLDLPGVRRIRARRFEITTAGRPVEVQINGDPRGTTPISVEPLGRVRLLTLEGRDDSESGT